MIIFDFDGVLVDYRRRFWETYRNVLRGRGLPCPPQERLVALRRKGLTTEAIWETLIPEMADRDTVIAACIRKRNAIIEEPEYLKRDRLFPGYRKLLRNLDRAYVVSGRKRREPIERVLGPLSGRFTVITNEGREPDLVFKTRVFRSLDASCTIGDTRLDIRAGKAARLSTVGVLTGIDGKELLIREKPDAIVKDLFSLPIILRRFCT